MTMTDCTKMAPTVTRSQPNRASLGCGGTGASSQLNRGFHKIKQHNIENNQKCFLSSKIIIIRMISEGSCDTEDWSNDAEISSLHHRYNLDFKRYSNKKIDLIGEQNK